MKSLLLAFLALIPLSAYSSVTYSFSEYVRNYGSYGFTLTTPDYVSLDSTGWYTFGSNMLTACDTTANPIYICSGGSFKYFPVTGALIVNMDLRDPNGSGFGATNSMSDTFLGASLTTSGTYSAFNGGTLGGGAMFSVVGPTTEVVTPEPAVAPEPAGGTLLAAGLGVLALFQVKKASRSGRSLFSSDRSGN